MIVTEIRTEYADEDWQQAMTPRQIADVLLQLDPNELHDILQILNAEKIQ